MELPPHARAVLSGPDFVARRLAGSAGDPQQRWMLKRPRELRRDYLRAVIDGGEDQERWMLQQDDTVCRSYVDEVLVHEPDPDRAALWLLKQPRGVRLSYVAEVLSA